MNVYLVKDLDTGLFSKGGSDPEWVKPELAKRWKKPQHASSHVGMVFGAAKATTLYRTQWEARKAHPNVAVVECEVKLDEGIAHKIEWVTPERVYGY